MVNEEIVVLYTSVDRCRIRRKFRTLDGARAFAQKYVGKHPDQGMFYAVSDDGVGKIEVSGCSLDDLFPPPEAVRRFSFEDQVE